MPLPVSLSEFAGEMQLIGDGCTLYLNRATGEFYMVTDNELSLVDEDDDDSELRQDWELEARDKIREIMNSTDWLELPSKFEIDEYRIMRDFCGTVADDIFRHDLLDTIGGRGTFGRFKSMLARRNLLDDWYKFHTEAFKEIAKSWLERHGIDYRNQPRT